MRALFGIIFVTVVMFGLSGCEEETTEEKIQRLEKENAELRKEKDDNRPWYDPRKYF